MRPAGVIGCYPPFPAAIPERGRVLHVLLSRSPLASSRRKVPFDLHVLGAPPAFILSQDRTLRPMCRNRPDSEPGPDRLNADRIHRIEALLPGTGSVLEGPPCPLLERFQYKMVHVHPWKDRGTMAPRPACGIRFSRCPPPGWAARQGVILPAPGARRKGEGGSPQGEHNSIVLSAFDTYILCFERAHLRIATVRRSNRFELPPIPYTRPTWPRRPWPWRSPPRAARRAVRPSRPRRRRAPRARCRSGAAAATTRRRTPSGARPCGSP